MYINLHVLYIYEDKTRYLYTLCEDLHSDLPEEVVVVVNPYSHL